MAPEPPGVQDARISDPERHDNTERVEYNQENYAELTKITMRLSPFRDGDSHASFRNMREETLREIDRLENDYVLKASPAELERFYIEKATINPLVLDVDGYYIDDQKGTEIDVSRDFNRAIFPGSRAVVKGTRLTIAVPFTGDPMLWRVRASTYSLSGYPEIHVGDGIITFEHQFPDDAPPAPDHLKSEIQRSIASLSSAAAHLANDVATHNREVTTEVQAAIARKLQKAKAATNTVAGLGIPIKAKSTPATFVAPAKRKESPVARPSVPKEKFAPEPVLEQREFEHILGVIRSMALVIERSPASFASLDEEAIRTHFLLQLNGHYEGSATGETFNSAGKTDILIRVDNRNVFIAECKFWRGAKSYEEAVDQLLGYLSWRDSKCALLIFNKTKDSSSVRAKMHEIMTGRAEHRKTVSHDPQGDSRYTFVKASDPGREIQIQTMLFDIPTN